MIVKCKKCGSTNVEVRTWINPNTMETSSLGDIHCLISKPLDCWCKECSDNVVLTVDDSSL